MPTPTQPTPQLTIDGFEVTRLDFFLQADGTTIVHKLGSTPYSRGNHVVLETDQKPVDLDASEAWLHRHGFSTRRWPATAGKPAGMRAWKADQPWPIRTEGQIRHMRQTLGQLGHSLNLAFDL